MEENSISAVKNVVGAIKISKTKIIFALILINVINTVRYIQIVEHSQQLKRNQDRLHRTFLLRLAYLKRQITKPKKIIDPRFKELQVPVHQYQNTLNFCKVLKVSYGPKTFLSAAQMAKWIERLLLKR